MLKVYFLGSGEIAIPVLDALYKSKNVDLIGAGTQPDRPAGRKRKLMPTPMGCWSDANNIDIDRVESVNEQIFLDKLQRLSPDIILVISFGQLLKQEILKLPAIACVNIHASLLPKYRGASPIVASIMNGDTKTGISYIEMEMGLDTGPVYVTYDYKLDTKINAGTLEQELGVLSAKTVEKTLLDISSKSLTPIEQNHLQASLSKKIKKSDGRITWQKSAQTISQQVRAYTPWPGAFFELELPSRKGVVKITECTLMEGVSDQAGRVVQADKSGWVVACSQGAVKLDKVIPQGKREMSGADFLRGCKIEQGSFL